MAGIILTPITLWSDFNIDVVPTAEIVKEVIDGDYVYTDIYLQGRKVVDDTVRIYVRLTKKKDLKKSPAILLLKNFTEKDDKALVCDLAQRGYAVYEVDLGGFSSDKWEHTEYPVRVQYANYENAKDNLYTVKGEVKQTCWYEWACVGRYVLAYMQDNEEITSIGGLGIGRAATVLWMLAGTDNGLSCAAFALNAGWSGYRGIYKFAGKVEPQFSDNMYKYIAGIEPQSYAMHVKCPVLVLSALNSSEYDCDRAYDTVSRIDNETFTAVSYAIGNKESINENAYASATVFFEKFLTKSASDKKALCDNIDIKCDIVDGKICIEVEAPGKNIKEVALYVSEGIVNPALRSWSKITDCKKSENGVCTFTYVPNENAEIVTMFAQCEYKSGFMLGSNILSKRFNKEQIDSIAAKSNIIYSSRLDETQSIFSVYDESDKNQTVIDFGGNRLIKVQKGPMGIDGIWCKNGLITFKNAAPLNKPQDDAMLMFDCYTKDEGQITVKLIADYYGEKTEYACVVNIRGGDVWHNVKLEHNRFKTLEGMSLKSYQKIEAVAFTSDSEEWLINNALWV